MLPANATEEVVLQCAARAAGRYLLTAQAFRRTLTSVTSSDETYDRALHVVERRTVLRKLVPAPAGRGRLSAAIPEPEDVDPWSIEPAVLEKQSRVLADCPACLGAKKVSCPDCDGTTRVRCAYCGGGGRVRGQRGMKNCPDCRGSGRRKCTLCRGGKTECSVCDASGRVEAWLEIQSQILKRVCVHSQTPAAEVHAGLDDPDDFDAGAETWRNQLLNDSGELPPPKKVPEELSPALDPRTERKRSSRVQKFRGRVYRLRYVTPLGDGVILVCGQPPEVLRSSDWRPLARRKRTALASAGLLGLGAVAVSGFYCLRHPWFLQYGQGLWVVGSALLAAVAAALTFSLLLLPAPARRQRLLGLAAACTVVFVILTGLVYTRIGPTAKAAAAALAAGDRERARLTAEGLHTLGQESAQGEEILDALHEEELRATKTLDELNQRVREPWYSPAKRQAAVDRLRGATLQEGDQLYAKRRAEPIEQLAHKIKDLLPEADQKRLAWQAALVRAEDCGHEGKAACIGEQLDRARSAGAPLDAMQEIKQQSIADLKKSLGVAMQQAKGLSDLTARRQALQEVQQQAVGYEQLAEAAAEPSAEELAKQVVHLDQQIKKAEAREAQKAAREAARQQREAARQERAEREASRGLRCCDGTLSPSCSCSGSHRGCCSRHGGVCGCE